MKTELLNNIEVDELTSDTDFLNHLPKANAITSFLEDNYDNLGANKMLVLYGEWGSGKSTMLRHVEKKLAKGNIYYPIVFKAWEHEKDENLALSLADVIAYRINDSNTANNLLRTALVALKTLGKGVTVKGGPFDLNVGRIIEAADEEIDKIKESSEYIRVHKLKDDYKKAEEKLCIQEKKERIVVFIDDLDRCEPENVLALMSAIKLFFTFGHRTLFFFGVDKEAVNHAVRVKYGNVIKAEVYLEKIFDITFHVPRDFNLDKLLSLYFPRKVFIEGDSVNVYNRLTGFFECLSFTNPRHLKKVLNKYRLLTLMRHQTNRYADVPSGIFNEEGGIFETILILYVIILFEFYPTEYLEFASYEKRIRNYANSMDTSRSDRAGNLDWIQRNLAFDDNVDLQQIADSVRLSLANDSRPNTYNKVLSLFTPFTIHHLSTLEYSHDVYYSLFMKEHECIQLRFVRFLIRNKELIKTESRYKFWDLIKMANTLL
jgi:tRNA A37 threonylcarbamoyladenosine biosynthesis protein TsaE